MSNSNTTDKSSNVDDVGRLHRMVTAGFTAKLDHQLKKAQKKKGNPDLDIGTLDLAAAARWIAYNDVKCVSKNLERTSEIKDELQAIRDKQRGKKIVAVGE